MVIVRALKDIISIKIKTRHDDYSDQFSRLFMTKMLIIAGVIMGFDYFSDKINCMVTKTNALSKDYIHSACWISGFYIYAEMRDRLEDSAYWGIPRKIDEDGIHKYTYDLCLSKQSDINEFSKNDCVPMKRLYYLQYQWMPFYVGALAIIYYLPYILFRIVNTDLISLKGDLKSTTSDAEDIVKNYFNYKINPISKLRLRIWYNGFVKITYILVNIFAFLFTNYLLHGNYIDYGKRYVFWSELNSTEQHGKLKFKLYPKPGNVLLPSMGFCELLESAYDTVSVEHKKGKYICELSQNILYQYVLMVLWFLFVISILISCAGCFFYVGGHFYRVVLFGKWVSNKSLNRGLTLREMEYLIFIKKKNMVMYGDVVRTLHQHREDLEGKFCNGYKTSKDFV